MLMISVCEPIMRALAEDPCLRIVAVFTATSILRGISHCVAINRLYGKPIKPCQKARSEARQLHLSEIGVPTHCERGAGQRGWFTHCRTTSQERQKQPAAETEPAAPPLAYA